MLTKIQRKSLNSVTSHLGDEDQNFRSYMLENGYSDEDVERFESLPYGEQVMFFDETPELKGHIYYDLLIIKSI